MRIVSVTVADGFTLRCENSWRS